MAKFQWRKARERDRDRKRPDSYAQPVKMPKAKPRTANGHPARYSVPHRSGKSKASGYARPCMVCGAKREVVTITDGANPDGTLRILTFCSQQHATDAWRAPLGQWKTLF
jgi:hypothetical protein